MSYLWMCAYLHRCDNKTENVFAKLFVFFLLLSMHCKHENVSIFAGIECYTFCKHRLQFMYELKSFFIFIIQMHTQTADENFARKERNNKKKKQTHRLRNTYKVTQEEYIEMHAHTSRKCRLSLKVFQKNEGKKWKIKSLIILF